MSTKSVAGGLLAVDQADVVMVTLNLIQTEEQVVIHTAHQKKKGVLIKKALASGHMQAMRTDHTVQNTLKYILEEPGVSSIVIGTINPTHLQENVAAIPEGAQ